jgi:hypothetical protein
VPVLSTANSNSSISQSFFGQSWVRSRQLNNRSCGRPYSSGIKTETKEEKNLGTRYQAMTSKVVAVNI